MKDTNFEDKLKQRLSFIAEDGHTQQYRNEVADKILKDVLQERISAQEELFEKINKEWLSLELRYVEPREKLNRELERFSVFMQYLSNLTKEK